MNLILVRHGETDWNRIGRCQGFSDVELNGNGRKQIEALAKSLRDENIGAIYSSDLKRATDTANAIARYHNLPVRLERGLREMDQGELEGLTFVEIRERYADLMMEWRLNTETVRLPGGESLKEVQERAWRVIEGIANRHSDETVVTVSHNLTIVALLCKFTGVGLTEFTRFKLQATSKNLVLFKNGYTRVEVINDIAHLSPDLITEK
ncbi:MAG TPA: histidine phosphatase family protein [Thermodesulfobacteriota bacterium]|nr:histidine phosphatase family protein [Thermodesulfobacteriota bacterium]